jgi:hypothetical protein
VYIVTNLFHKSRTFRGEITGKVYTRATGRIAGILTINYVLPSESLELHPIYDQLEFGQFTGYFTAENELLDQQAAELTKNLKKKQQISATKILLGTDAIILRSISP